MLRLFGQTLREAPADVESAGQRLLLCSGCDPGAGSSAGLRIESIIRGAQAAALPVEEVAAPGTSTIEGLAAFIDISPSSTTEAVLTVGGFGEHSTLAALRQAPEAVRLVQGFDRPVLIEGGSW